MKTLTVEYQFRPWSGLNIKGILTMQNQASILLLKNIINKYKRKIEYKKHKIYTIHSPQNPNYPIKILTSGILGYSKTCNLVRGPFATGLTSDINLIVWGSSFRNANPTRYICCWSIWLSELKSNSSYQHSRPSALKFGVVS